jgi:tetratricopeptide (TPR) repeat protein
LDVNGLALVHRFISEHYDLEELRTLCFDLGIDHENLPGKAKEGLARELVRWAGHNKHLADLLAKLHDDRPAPFDKSGLSLAPEWIDTLYSDLAAFEQDSAPLTAWDRFRRTRLFYPAVGVGAVVILVIVVASIASTIGSMSGVRQELRSAGLIPTLTPTFTPAPTPTPTATAIPLAFAPASQGETLLVVATFHEAQNVVGTEAQDEIRRGIQAAAKEAGFEGLRVEVEPTVLEAEDRAAAEELGKRYDASMVIWGAITGARVTVNFLNLKQPNFDAARATVDEIERTQLANPSEYSSFITSDLPGQMVFLSMFAVSQSYSLEGRYKESLQLIEIALSRVTGNGSIEGLAEAHFLAGWLYGMAGDIEYAIAAYDRAIAQRPGYASAYNNRGNARHINGDLARAIADYDQAIRLRPDSAPFYNNRGLVRRDSGNLAGAIADYDDAIRLQPDFAIAYNSRGAARAVNNDLAGAIADFDQAIKLQPDYADAYSNRGLARSDGGDLVGAIADYNQAIRLQPNYANAYNNRGVARQASGDLVGAIADYDQAIRLQPGSAHAYNSRGNARKASGDLVGAIADYDQAIELQPDYAEAYSNRGFALQASGDAAGAIADFGHAITLQPDNADLYNNRGVALCDGGDLKAAIADFDQAIRLQSNHAMAYSNRGVARYRSGDLAGAFADFDQAIELQPDYANAYTNRGFARQSSGDLRGAIADYSKASEQDPNSLGACSGLCRTYGFLEEPDRALEYCTRAVNLTTSEDRLQYREDRGIVYSLLGRYSEAIADFEAVVAWQEQQPGDNSAMLARRRAWIDALKRGENPFTPEVLKELQQE